MRRISIPKLAHEIVQDLTLGMAALGAIAVTAAEFTGDNQVGNYLGTFGVNDLGTAAVGLTVALLTKPSQQSAVETR